MNLFQRMLAVCWVLMGSAPLHAEDWNSRLGRGDGEFEAQTFRVERLQGAVETVLPARGVVQSRVRVELDAAGRLIRSRTDYPAAELASWYRADFLLTEVQPGASAENLAFQRVWKNEVQDAKNLVWGPEYVEFSTLPFLLERKLAAGPLDTWSFRTYFGDTPGTMQVRVLTTDRPLDVEKRYSYPRWLRERFGNRRVILAELTAVGDFKGGYPYPFYYAFTPGQPRWIAAWGGNPRSASFQWAENSVQN